LLAMAVFLLLPDLRRLANVLVLNRPAEAVELRPQLGERWRWWAPAARTLFVLALIALSFQQARENEQVYQKQSPFRGIWNVEEFALEGAPRWRRVVFDYPHSLGVQLMTDARQRFRLTLDESKRTLTLRPIEEPLKKFTIGYTVAAGVMTLDGQLDGKRLQARLRRMPMPSFRLTSRGFHWINETPFNR